jgi:hypothetical protein
MVDPGTPLGASKTVSPEGVSDAAPGGHIGGYSLIKADDLDAAVGLVKNHPFVGRGGSLQVPAVVRCSVPACWFVISLVLVV